MRRRDKEVENWKQQFKRRVKGIEWINIDSVTRSEEDQVRNQKTRWGEQLNPLKNKVEIVQRLWAHGKHEQIENGRSFKGDGY